MLAALHSWRRVGKVGKRSENACTLFHDTVYHNALHYVYLRSSLIY